MRRPRIDLQIANAVFYAIAILSFATLTRTDPQLSFLTSSLLTAFWYASFLAIYRARRGNRSAPCAGRRLRN